MQYEISKFSPCEEALKFRAQFDTFEQAWNACERGDWLLWLAKKVGVGIKTFTKAKALCANTVRHLATDERTKNAVDVALSFADGKASKEELKKAADAAANRSAAYCPVVKTYADAALYAAALSTADAHYAAYYAAAAADEDSVCSKLENQKQTAQICREVLTDEVFRCLGLG